MVEQHHCEDAEGVSAVLVLQQITHFNDSISHDNLLGGAQEHLAGLTTNPTVLRLQLWTTRAVRRGEEGCEMIDDFPPYGGQPNTKSSPGICPQECREKNQPPSKTVQQVNMHPSCIFC